MPSSITRLAIGTAVAIGLAIGVTAIGSAVAQSTVERPETIATDGLTSRPGSRAPETKFGLGDHQQLRRLFLDSPRERLR
jgi:hypothetical protein